MAFIPRTFQAITQELVAWLLASPEAAAAAPDMDLNIGSIERSHLEAVAVEVEGLEVRAAQAVQEGIQESCYRAFGFTRNPARAASGSVVFTALVAPVGTVSIPSSTRLQGPNGQVFTTTANAQLAAGETITAAVPIQALVPGPAGNVPAHTITRMVSSIPGIDLVTNPSPALGGADIESDEARALRFSAYVQTIPRGTMDALEYGAMSTGHVAAVRVIEPFLLDPRPEGVPYSGLVWVFCDDGSGGLGTPAQAQIQKVLDGYTDGTGTRVPGWKASGVRVEVRAASVAEVCLRGAVQLHPGGAARWDAIKTVLTDAAKAYFDALRIGDPVSYPVLSAALNGADPDVAEVDIWLWFHGTDAPGYGSVPVAGDLSPVVSSDPDTLGARGVLDQAGIYPEWILA